MMEIDIFNTKNKYRVIYADPPWTFETYTEAGKDRSAEQHYKCQSLEDIKKLPVPKLCESTAFLFLWVTFPTLPQGLEVMKAWGFEYKSCAFNWLKLTKKGEKAIKSEDNLVEGEALPEHFFTGMGYYTRANSELCLLGRRGTGPVNRKSGGVRQVVLAPRREHSRKPDEINQRIETLLDGPYIELFARTQRPGWDCWGNQVDMFKNESD